jgi:hypothetical protein
MRAKLGITTGSHIQFALRENELVITPELPRAWLMKRAPSQSRKRPQTSAI